MLYTAMSSADYPGHSITKADAVLVIDLDETLLSINSFPMWAAYSLYGKFDRLRFKQRSKLRIQAGKIFFKRKILKRSHAQTKEELHKLWLDNHDDSALENILAKLQKKIRPNMLEILELISKSRCDALIATAATSLYAEKFAARIGFANIISTRLNEQENRGEEKARRILEFIAQQKWEGRKKIFFTDHLEDMPFIRKSDKLMWFGKSNEVKNIQKILPELNIVMCSNLSAQDIMNEVQQH